MKKLTATETIAEACKLRPPLKPFLEAFEPLFSRRQSLALKLAPMLAEAQLFLSENPGEKPLLRERLPAGLASFLHVAALDILPLLLSLEVLAPYKDKLENLFSSPENEHELEELLLAMLSDSPESLLMLADKYGLEPQILEFASEFIISTVLHALVMSRENDEFPGWHKGICPVCGMPPVIAWLDRRPPVENNEFLANGGGRKHLHCGMCGTNWHFLRGVCPSCGIQGEDAMQILGEEDRRHERLDWCKNCHSYLPQVDLREMAGTPDMDAMALCLLHLDLYAAEKGLVPLKPSFWNMF